MRTLCIVLCFLLAGIPALAAEPDDYDDSTSNEDSFSLTLILAGVIALGLAAIIIFGNDSGTDEVVVSESTVVEAPEDDAVEDTGDDGDTADDIDSDFFDSIESGDTD